MMRSTQSNTQKSGVNKVNAVACRPSMHEVIAQALQGLSAKFIAPKAHASPRTVEGWKQGKSVPHGEHVLAMLSDDQLCARLLKAAGQHDPAHAQETIVALRTALGMVNEGK